MRLIKTLGLCLLLVSFSACGSGQPRATSIDKAHAQDIIPDQDITVDFASMPKNLKLEYSSTGTGQGGGWVQYYRGKDRGHYVMDYYRLDGSKWYTAFNNTEGHNVRREYADGNVRTYTPHRCIRVPGKCAYRYANTTTGGSGTSTAKLTKRGSKYTYIARWRTENGGRGSATGTFSLGQYNVGVSGHWRRSDGWGSEWKLESMTVPK